MHSPSPLAIPDSVEEANQSFLDERRELAIPILTAPPGLDTAHRLGKATDQWLCELWHRAVPTRFQDEVSLYATGGYGREELALHSDIDILIALHDPAAANDEAFTLAMERLMAWSRHTRVRLSHAVRSPEQARRALDQDLRSAVALLDLRHLAGPSAPAEAFRRRCVIDHLRGDDEGRQFVASLIDGLRRRIDRQGQTVFLLEPDVKNGEGGLRDLNCLAWAARVRWRLDVRRDTKEAVGWAAPRRDAYCRRLDALLALRNQLHLLRERKHDRLTFREQEALIRLDDIASPDTPDEALAAVADARSLAESPPDDDGTRASLYPQIESMMARHYRRARAISTTCERCLRRWTADETPSDDLPGPFELRNGQIARSPSATFDDAEVFDALMIADRRDLLLDPRLEAELENRVADWPAGPELAPELAHRLCDLLVDPDISHRTSRRLLDLGIMPRAVPEFEPLICHVQHDLYHVYTTDVHSLKCLEEGRTLVSIDPDEHRRPEFCSIGADIEDPTTFLLACLFHDIGKGRGGQHSRRGEALMKSVAPRLGLDAEGTERVAFLVRHHLDLSTTSRRRDISDPEIIDELARRLGSVQVLNQLTALTYCDMSTVGPEVMNDWNASLLMELYHRLRRALEQRKPDAPGEASAGPDGVDTDRLRRDIAAEFSDGDTPNRRHLPQFVADLPADHLEDAAPAQLARQYRTYSEALEADDDIAVDLRPIPERGVTEIVVCSPDSPGTLARIAGAIASIGVNIMAADIVTTDSGLALDIFRVAHFNPRAVPPARPRPVQAPRRLERIEQRIAEVLSDQVDVDELLKTRREEQRLAPRPVPAVATEIHVDRKASTRFTVIEVRAPDRLGLLYSIARTLLDCRVNTRVSRIDSLGHQVIDTFYVEEWDHTPLSPPRTDEIVTALHRTLDTESDDSDKIDKNSPSE